MNDKKILFIGVGGAGCNSVSRLVRNGLRGEFVAVNSDAQHLSVLHKKIKKIVIGRKLMRGAGCSGNVELGEKCAKEDEKALVGVLEKADAVVLCLGLGGGLGTGAAPFIAELAKKQGAFVLAATVYPFKLEKARCEKARAGLKKLQGSCDAVILLDNHKLVKLVPNLPISEAFSAMDGILAKTLGGLFECAGGKPPKGISWSNLRMALCDGALCTITWGSGKRKEGVAIAAKEALKQSFADDGLVDAYSSIVMLYCGNDVRANDVLHAVSAMDKEMGCVEFCMVPRPKLVSDRFEICGIAIGVRAPVHNKKEELNRALFDAAIKGNVKEAEKLLKKGADILWSEADGGTVLHKAVSHPEMVRLLINKGAKVDAVDVGKTQPIHCAAYRGILDSVKILVEAGADPKAKTSWGGTPLHLAAASMKDYSAKTNHPAVIEYLVGCGVEVNAKYNEGDTPLHRAIANSSIEAIECLLKAGADVNAADMYGQTPLHGAVARMNMNKTLGNNWKTDFDFVSKVIKLLLKNGADPNVKSMNGETPKDRGGKTLEKLFG